MTMVSSSSTAVRQTFAASRRASTMNTSASSFVSGVFSDATPEEGERAQYLATLSVCLAMLSVGCACGAIAGALVYIEAGTVLGTLPTTAKGAVVAALPLGATFGLSLIHI